MPIIAGGLALSLLCLLHALLRCHQSEREIQRLGQRLHNLQEAFEASRALLGDSLQRLKDDVEVPSASAATPKAAEE